jgi:hypothetical protein
MVDIGRSGCVGASLLRWPTPASGACCDRADAFAALHRHGSRLSSGNVSRTRQLPGSTGEAAAVVVAAAGEPTASEGSPRPPETPQLAEAGLGHHAAAVFFPDVPWTPREAWAAHKDFAFEVCMKTGLCKHPMLALPEYSAIVVLNYNPMAQLTFFLCVFVEKVCPQGNGVDTHRTWEALALGSIPLVRTSSLDPLFVGLPVLVLRHWAELAAPHAQQKLARWQAVLAPYFEKGSARNAALRERLTVEHWHGLVARTQAWLKAKNS